MTAASASRWDLDRLLVVLGSLSNLVAGIAFAGWSVVGFFSGILDFAPAIPGWAFAIGLAFFARPWVYLAAGILNALMPLMVLFVFGAVMGLADPLAGPEYQALVLLVLGLVLSLWGGISGFLRARKGTLAPLGAATSTTRGLGSIVAAAFIIGVVATSGLAGTAMKEISAAGGGSNVVPDETVTLVTEDFVFSPRELRIPAGKLVEVAIENKDTAAHTFTYHADGKTYDTFLPGETTVKVLLRFDTAQTVHFWCKPHSGGQGDTSPDSMVGTMVVA